MQSSYLLGLTFIVLVSVIWSAASILVQYVYQGLNFNSPFLVTYIGSSLFVVLIPTTLLWERRNRLRRWISCTFTKIPHLSTGPSGIYRSSSSNDDTPDVELSERYIPWKVDVKVERSREILQDFENTERFSNEVSGSMGEDFQLIPARCRDEDTLSHVDHIRMAFKIAPLWFVSNYFYNISLAYTTITSSTVLSSTGSIFTFTFALVFGDERFTKWKLMGVCLAFVGSILTSLHDASQAKDGDNQSNPYDHQLWGDAAGLVSAIGYGGYTVLIRVLCPQDESLMSMPLFLGYIGFINAISLCPFLFWTLAEMDDGEDQSDDEGIHDNSQKLTMFILSCLIVKGLLDNVLSDYLWARSILLTSATVATVGLGLTIPIALISDVFIMRRSDVLNFGSMIGAILVLVGFILTNVGEGSNVESKTGGATSQSNESI